MGQLLAVLLLALPAFWSQGAEQVDSTYREANSLFRGQRYAEALGKTSQALQRTGSGSGLYWSFRLLKAQILLGKRDAKGAEEALAFELPPHARTPRNTALYLFCRGFLAIQQHDTGTARARLEAAAATARNAGEGELLAEVENRLGALAVDQGRFDDAGKYLRSALDYATGHSVQWLAISATSNLGYWHMHANQFDEAIPYFERAALAAHQFGVIETEARNAGNLGLCYYRVGDLDRAIVSFQQAEARFRSTGNLSEQEIWLGNIGNIYLGRLEYDSASGYYRRALEIARALGSQGKADAASWLTNLSRISIETNHLDAAEVFNNEGLSINRQLGLNKAEVYSTLNAAVIASERGKFSQAETLLRNILRGSFDDPAPRLRAHAQLALVLSLTHRSAAARAEFRTAIAEMETRRDELVKDEYKFAYLSSLIGFYQDFIRFLMDSGKVREALEVADSSHARTMQQRLRIAGTSGFVQRRAVDFQKLAEASGSTLLSYSLGVGLRNSYLWIVTPTEVKAVVLPGESELRPLIEAYDKSIQELRDPLARQNTAGEKLYTTLLAPASPYMNKKGRVIVVPDGLLYSLNFETLPVPGPKPRYWIEDATISIAPSLGLLNQGGKAGAQAANSLLLIGNPVSPVAEFPDLAFAESEMASVARSMPGTRQVVLRGKEARPSAWAQVGPENFDLIHFTAHATASRDEPLESAVILSRDETGAYKLHAKDVVKTPINARLVTLSACRSAGARIYSGEGPVGLAWAFLESGAHNVIAGLWDVNDESGAKTMAQLYAGLAAGRGPGAALRDAKLGLIRSGMVYRKPWYWGAFQLFTTDARN